MLTSRALRKGLGAVIPFAAVCALTSVPAMAASIGATAAAPNSVPVGVATTVTVTSIITDTSLISGSVQLQSLNASGVVVSVLGTLHDDGVSGDATANDNTYTVQTTVYQTAPGPLTFRVSAGFKGSLLRVNSAPVVVNVTGASIGVNITSPANLLYTNTSPVSVRGSVGDPNAHVTINGINAPVTGGQFLATVPLVEGLNTLTAVATNTGGAVTTASVQVTLDTTPPHITIDSPGAGTTTTAASITVTGTVNDVVVGTVNGIDAQVTVNGITAQVANRTYSAANVPLAVGPNTIQATGRDRAGNGTTVSTAITRSLPSAPPSPAIGASLVVNSLNIVSGNNQTGTIGTTLPAPLLVSMTNSAGLPVANQPVVFKVTGNNGTVTGGGAPASAVIVNTNSAGQAQAVWTLGQRAGAGINTVEVSAAVAVGPVGFVATGTTAKATQIVVDSGNHQTGALNQPLTFPFVAVVTDSGYNRVPNVPVSFTVTQGGGNLGGSNTLQVSTDSNGRAIALLTLGSQPGNDNNQVQATFSGNPGYAVVFTASAKTPGNPANTTISGLVLDNSNNPISSVTLRLFLTNQANNNNLPLQVGTPVQTSSTGTFLIPQAPVGYFKLMADGSTAAGPKSYPTLEYDIVTVAGQDNTVGTPIYLPALDTVNKLCVDATHGGTLNLPQSPGFALTVLPGSATFPGGSKTGCVSVTTVNGDKVPMAPGFGQQPRFIVSIQPAGTVFNPPAPITIPNVDGLKPRSITEMYSYDHDLSEFIAIGTGTVSADGSVIASNAGVGVLKAGWHCGGNPNSTGTAGECGYCATCVNNMCSANDSLVPPQTGAQQCQRAVCSGGSVAIVPDDSRVPSQTGAPQCKKLICSGGSTSAVADPSQDGKTCDDNDPTTIHDTCNAGVCKGKNVVITSVWSDQFPGVRANYLPGGTGRDPYIFMATRADGNVYVKAQVDLKPSDSEGLSSILVRLAKFGVPMGDTVGLNGNIASLSSGDPSLAVTVQEYDIVAGADTNGNGILDQSEVLANSTFLTGAPHSFKVVPPAVFTVNRTGALGATLFTPVLYPIASSLLQAFAGNVVPDGATTVQSVTIAKNELVHNVGAFFDSNGTAQIPSYGFPSSSLFAQKILFSPEFSTCVSNTLTAHTQEVRSYFNQASVGSSHQFVWQMISNDPQNSGNIIFPDSKDLFLAYGTTQSLNATVSATVVVNPSQQLELIQLLINGNIQDTYAWDYERGGVDAQAATIQAGFGTLGQGGQVYKTVVDLSGPFVLTSPYFF